jgi:hypothetical protein
MSKESWRRLVKALEASRRTEKKIIEADAREDNALTERIAEQIQRSASRDNPP